MTLPVAIFFALGIVFATLIFILIIELIMHKTVYIPPTEKRVDAAWEKNR